jgi:DNA-binding helix-hairpin-helix protein with protein kinase domain
MLTVIDGAGTELTLGAIRFEGGEGQIFQHPSNPQMMVKVYKKPDPMRASKVEALLRIGAGADERLLKMAAWPQQHVLIKQGQDWQHVGFTMRKVSGDAIHSMYSPKERKVNYPEFTWLNLLQLAKNSAAAFHFIHSTGTVMGDVNESNFVVDPKTGVTSLIDCDSYQVTYEGYVYRCEVGVGQWTPPELHGASFGSIDRSPNHDRFGLAVLIFQLLFIGRHPFSSPAEGDLDKAIQQHLFTYAEALKAKGYSQPIMTLLNRDVSTEVFDLFERAFLSGSSFGDVIEACPKCTQKNRIPRIAQNPTCPKCGSGFQQDWNTRRPSAEQWHVALTQMESRLIKCRSNSLHYHLNQQDCPFCRLDKMGVPVFNYKGAGADNITLTPDAMVVRLWQEIRQVATLSLHAAGALPAVVGTPAPAGISKTNPAFVIGWLVIIVAGGLMISVGGASWLVLIVGFILIAQGKEGKAFRELRAQRTNTATSFRQLAAQSQQKLEKLVADRTHSINNLKLEAEKCHRSLTELPAKQRQSMQNLETRRRELQLEAFLDQFFVSKQKFKGLGPKRVGTLQAYGIETAWDIRRHHRPNRIPDQVWRDMKSWSASKETGFRFNPSIPISPQEIAAVNSQLMQEKLQLQTRLQQYHTQVAHISRESFREQTVLEKELLANRQRQQQADADLAVLGS